MSLPSSETPNPPQLTHLYTLHATIAPALYTASVPHGTRRVYPITGGTFLGPRGLSGTVENLGADWGLVEGTTGIFHADTRYALRVSSSNGEEDDGTYIYVRTSGPSQPEAVGGGLHLRGEFEVGEGQWWWLNHIVAVGKTQKVKDHNDGGFTLRIDMWYMSSPNDQLTTAPTKAETAAKM